MTETEKRRSELLAQTRARYSEKYTPPAIHPRYQSTYHSIYQDDETTKTNKRRSSFGVRLMIAILLFGLYAFANDRDMQEAKTVMNEIADDAVGFVDFTFFD